MKTLTTSGALSYSWHKNSYVCLPMRALMACGAAVKAFFCQYTVRVTEPETITLMANHPKAWFTGELKELKNRNIAVVKDDGASCKVDFEIDSTSQTQLQNGKIGEVIKLDDGRYIAEGMTTKGEHIYFTLIPVDDKKEGKDNGKGKWTAFAKSCDEAYVMLYRITNDVRRDGVDCDDELYNSLKLKIENEKKLREECNKTKFGEALEGLQAALSGFIPTTGYVAYVSRTPDFDPNTMPDNGRRILFGEACEIYKDILMAVTSKPFSGDGKEIYQTRGIFRSPFSYPDGGYARISTQLQAFTAKAMAAVKPSLKNMLFTPMRHMRDIMYDAVGPENYTIKKTKEMSPDLQSQVELGGFEIPAIIPISVLKGLHD